MLSGRESVSSSSNRDDKFHALELTFETRLEKIGLFCRSVAKGNNANDIMECMSLAAVGSSNGLGGLSTSG
jgi:hypothetical protein